MRILSRVIAAGVLVLPMALVASGVAAAGMAADSTALPAQIGAPEDDSSAECDDDTDEIFKIFGGEDYVEEGECGEDDNGLLG